MNQLILDMDFIRCCLLNSGSEMRRILESDLQQLEEERDQIMRNFAAHKEDLRKQRLRRRWPRSRIATVNQLRKERGYNLWTGSHQMTRKEELEMYWMEHTAENKKRFKRKRWKRKKSWWVFFGKWQVEYSILYLENTSNCSWICTSIAFFLFWQVNSCNKLYFCILLYSDKQIPIFYIIKTQLFLVKASSCMLESTDVVKR